MQLLLELLGPIQSARELKGASTALKAMKPSHVRPAGSKRETIRYGTWGSQVIPQPSTSQAQPRLTSEF